MLAVRPYINFGIGDGEVNTVNTRHTVILDGEQPFGLLMADSGCRSAIKAFPQSLDIIHPVR
jgi:hypothetical protein